jgi:hypothetical protein
MAGVGLIALVTIHVYFAVRPEKLDITKSMIFGSMRREFYLEHYDPERWSLELPQPEWALPKNSHLPIKSAVGPKSHH